MLHTIGEEALCPEYATESALFGAPRFKVQLTNRRILINRKQSVLGFIPHSMETSILYRCDSHGTLV